MSDQNQNLDPNVPPVGDSIVALLAAAQRIADYRNATLPEPLNLRDPDSNPQPAQQENVSLLLEWLDWVFYHLDNPGHQG